MDEDVLDTPFGTFPAFSNDPRETIVRRQDLDGYGDGGRRIGILLGSEDAADIGYRLPGVVDCESQFRPGI